MRYGLCLQCGGQQFCGGLPRADAALHEAAGAWGTLTQQGFAAAWQVFAAYGQRKASEAYKCRGCSARYYCDVCPAEMELLYGDAECRPEPVCGMARIREQFYNGKISREEALRQAVTL